MRITTAFVITMLGASAFAQTPPLEVKGVPLGATRQELITKILGMECGRVGGANICYVSVKSAVMTACPPRSASTDCMRSAYERLRFGPAVPEMYWADLRDEKVARIRVQFGATQFSAVVIALTEKYGTPSADAIEEIQNRMGAKFQNRVVKWDLADGSIRARERGADINTSDVTMETKEYSAASAAESEQKAKASAKAL